MAVQEIHPVLVLLDRSLRRTWVVERMFSSFRSTGTFIMDEGRGG